MDMRRRYTGLGGAGGRSGAPAGEAGAPREHLEQAAAMAVHVQDRDHLPHRPLHRGGGVGRRQLPQEAVGEVAAVVVRSSTQPRPHLRGGLGAGAGDTAGEETSGAPDGRGVGHRVRRWIRVVT